MIENKKIVITKNTCFDKGWALLIPYSVPYLKNKHFRALNLNDIVRGITYADTVNLILSEPCLSGQIVKELLWANQYCKINIIAKTQSILDRYAQLHFEKQEINGDIDFNYIDINGKTNIFAFIADDYINTDKRINDIYFEKSSIRKDFIFSENTKYVVFTDVDATKNYAEIIEQCIRRNIPYLYIIGSNAYKKETVHKFTNKKIPLLCSQKVKNGILYITDDDALYCVNAVSNGEFIPIELESFKYYFGNVYAYLGLPDELETQVIPQDVFVCENGNITPLQIQKTKVIERTVQFDSMTDFLNEKFDRSETELFNQYCAVAESVIYGYTLIPPLFNTTEISDIYNEVKSVYKQCNDIFSRYSLADTIENLVDLGLQNSKMVMQSQKIIEFNMDIRAVIGNVYYEHYYDIVNRFKLTISEIIDGFMLYCEELFTAVNTDNSETKFEKIDNEIIGYKQTIDEKRILVAQGTEVLSNKRRIEILEKKISDLTALKQKFTSGASTRDNKQIEAFISFCKNVLNGTYMEKSGRGDSISGVIPIKQNVVLMKLIDFIKTDLRKIHDLFDSLKEIANKFSEIDIPTEYIVYSQNGQRVIAIDTEQEYCDTETIQKKYNLHCKARRQGNEL